MLNAPQLSRLIDPVICRAQADSEYTRSGFVDRAARSVLTKLGLDRSYADASHVYRRRQHQLRRWQWIDQQVLHFLYSHPQATGIEVGGGLSTRFHRLCERMDWPRFSWRAINTHDVSDCIHFLFPLLDDHTSVASEAPLTDWCNHVHWTESAPKIVIIAEEQPLQSWQDFQQMYSNISDSLTPQTPAIDILLSHSIDNLHESITTSGYPVAVVNKLCRRQVKPNILSRLASFLSPPHDATVTTEHLVFYRPLSQESQ